MKQAQKILWNKSKPAQRQHTHGGQEWGGEAERTTHLIVWSVADVEGDATEQEERAEQRNDAHLLLTQQCRQHQLTAAVQ